VLSAVPVDQSEFKKKGKKHVKNFNFLKFSSFKRKKRAAGHGIQFLVPGLA
jgi:hypothetical protein